MAYIKGKKHKAELYAYLQETWKVQYFSEKEGEIFHVAYEGLF